MREDEQNVDNVEVRSWMNEGMCVFEMFYNKNYVKRPAEFGSELQLSPHMLKSSPSPDPTKIT